MPQDSPGMHFRTVYTKLHIERCILLHFCNFSQTFCTVSTDFHLGRNDEMELDIYWTTLLVLLPTVLLLAGRHVVVLSFKHFHEGWRRLRWRIAQQFHEKSEQASALLSDSHTPPPTPPPRHDQVSSFRWTFLSIYLVVMAPEWLSGPYLWSLLRDDKGLPESTVVALYATAYTSAAVSALVVGFLADRFGRRKACLAQCAIHSAACLTVIFGGECLPVLFLGRVLAGMALTLLWTVFESWMVTEWNARGLEREGGGGLSEMFAMMTTWNCGSAILGGVLCHCMVSVLGSKMWPFGTGIVSCVLLWNNTSAQQLIMHPGSASPRGDPDAPKHGGSRRSCAVPITPQRPLTCRIERELRPPKYRERRDRRCCAT